MELSQCLPFWNSLSEAQQQLLEQSATLHHVSKGQVIHNGTEDCVGILVLQKGQMRGYSLSSEGREVTLYRLFERDVCVLSAYCMLNSLQFDITVAAEKDSVFWRIPPNIYKSVMENSAPMANYTTELIANRLSDVMWLLDQILYKHLDSRVAGFLVSESRLNDSLTLSLTHEEIAHHLGSAREVVTRMLKYFANEGMVELGRGKVVLKDLAGLERIGDESLR